MSNYKLYTRQEDNVIKTLYPNSTNFCIGSLLKRTHRSIQGRAFILKLNKSKAFVDRKGNAGRFPKGHKPFNKGLIQSTYMSKENIEKTKKGRFKKGQTPHNIREVGSERLDKDGYTYVKVEGRKKWLPKQHLIYSQKYGKIPPNHAVVFKDGNKQNFELDNLELVSREELMARNTIHRYPQNVKLLLKRISNLNRIIYAKSNRK